MTIGLGSGFPEAYPPLSFSDGEEDELLALVKLEKLSNLSG